MERERAQQGPTEHQEASTGSRNITSAPSMPSSSAPVTPTPPRLTPNPTLLDSPPPTLTPTSSSSPPPLTPAPSLSASHAPKGAAATASSPHALIPTPPKLTSTASPALRTYSRPILPSPPGASKTTPASTTTCNPAPSLHPAMPLTLTSSSSSSTSSSSSPAAVAGAVPPPVSPSSSTTHGNTASSAKTSNALTNGNTRPVPTATSTAITPFHTPASPTGRQVSQAPPLGTPGLTRANQSPSPVRQRVSQQTLLLGKGLKGSGQDQVLLRAQMLQSLNLRPPPPGTLTNPPSLRLKPPPSAPPALSRPRNPLFPPLRPRPQPSATATEGPATPTRHLSVPPPTLYSPVRVVPLRPRLQSPNGHRVVLPKHSSSQPLAAPPASQSPPANRHLAGLKACPLSQTPPPRSQSKHSSIPVSSPLTPAGHFERSSSAARQLQIIALSSGHQPQPGNSARASVQSVAPVVESPERAHQSQRTLPSEDALPLSLKSLLPNASSPLPSPPSLLSPSLPLGQASPQEHPLIQQVKNQGDPRKGEEQRTASLREETRDEGGMGEKGGDRKEADIMMKKQHKEKRGLVTEKEEAPGNPKEQRLETDGEEERMEATDEGQIKSAEGEEVEEEKDEEETPMEQSEHPTSPKLTPGPITIQDSSLGPKPGTGLVPPQTPEPHRDLQPGTHEDLCENMSTQSDNQSALSSLSSQSPPSSPVTVPTPDNPPPLLPAQPTHQADLSVPQPEPDKFSQSQEEAAHLGQVEDEAESLGRPQSEPWTPRTWPEGRQVLTHLVEGFVIQEGLLPFPVNRSSLLVQDQVSKPQEEEVNGTNGKEALPLSEASERTDPVIQSSDSEEDDDEDGAADNAGTRSSHRDRAVLHCQFCGKRGHAHNFMRSKRFCSTSCARGFNVRLTKRLRALSAGRRSERPRPALNRAESVPGKPLLLRLPRDLWSAGRRERQKEDVGQGEEEMEGEVEEADEGGDEDPAVALTTKVERRSARRARRMSEPAVTTSTPTTTFKTGPAQWSVEEVTAFIHTLPGCGEVAESFRLQEIDGQALLLLTEDHLMTSMNIKLGPALKICAHINALKNQ
ncbi:polyhomeotic-like protein 3 isoform X2 [Lampris incognitus]|nr:polyhomeotic-like protein 3 isoform X2 [Lampris incognitus]